MTAGLILLNILMLSYITIKHNYQQQAAINVIKENGQTVAHILGHDIRLAGYIGCLRLSSDTPILSHINTTLSFDKKIQSEKIQYAGNTIDTIVIQHAESAPETLLHTMNTTSNMDLTINHPFYKGDILLISDCNHVEIFQVKEATYTTNSQTLTATTPLKTYFKEKSEISKLVKNRYFSAITDRADTYQQPIYALHKQDIAGKIIQIIDGVDEMIIHYNVQLQNHLIELDSSQVSDWSKVVSVSMCFLLRHANLKKTWCTDVALREI